MILSSLHCHILVSVIIPFLKGTILCFGFFFFLSFHEHATLPVLFFSFCITIIYSTGSWFFGQISIKYLRIWIGSEMFGAAGWLWLKSIMSTGAKQMAKFWEFILFLEDWAVTLDRWSMMCTRQFWGKKKWLFFCTLKPWYNEPRYSEFRNIVNKTQFPFWGFTKHITFDILSKVNYSI